MYLLLGAICMHLQCSLIMYDLQVFAQPGPSELGGLGGNRPPPQLPPHILAGIEAKTSLSQDLWLLLLQSPRISDLPTALVTAEVCFSWVNLCFGIRFYFVPNQMRRLKKISWENCPSRFLQERITTGFFMAKFDNLNPYYKKFFRNCIIFNQS